jgi:hypothetical protein
MKRFLSSGVLAVVVGCLPVLLVPVVVAASTSAMQPLCSTAGYERLWTPRPAELSIDIPAGDFTVVLELLNANSSVGTGFAQVGAILVAAPEGVCEENSGSLGVYTGPMRLDLTAVPVGQITVWARLTLLPVQVTTTTAPPDTTTTAPPDTTTTTIPVTTTTEDPDLPPGGVTTTTTIPPVTTTTLPPGVTTTTGPPLVPGQEPDVACVPGGFTVGDDFIPFEDAPQELFDQFPNCRSAFDEESG